jgi:FkbM family methyltransferase
MARFLDRFFCRVAGVLYSRVSHKALALQPDDLPFMRVSFSQFGEDLVIAEHLLGLRRPCKGIYVDAGCFDPFRYSNTRLLNLLGWRGINVDASEDSIRRFKLHRPGDDSVCAALDREERSNEFVQTVSGATSRLAEGANPLPPGLPVNARVAVRTRTLASVLAASPLGGEDVDFLDIDCEGSDLAVLQGFPLEDKRPTLVCLESHLPEEAREVADYLQQRDYREVCRRGPSLIFRDNRAG